MDAIRAKLKPGTAIELRWADEARIDQKNSLTRLCASGRTGRDQRTLVLEDQMVDAVREPLIKAPRQARGAFARIPTDTLVGMGFSNLVAFAIIVTIAATLRTQGTTDPATSSDAANAPELVAGRSAFTLFAGGIDGRVNKVV